MKQTFSTKMLASDDAPQLTQADFDRARLRVGAKEVTREEFSEAVREKLGKQRISIMLDRAVIEKYKALAGRRGYQTLINQTLAEATTSKQTEKIIRKVIREELQVLLTS